MDHALRIGAATDTQSASRRASELAQRQFGSIARRQLLNVGFSPTRVKGWVREGRLHPRYPGVYAWGRPDLSTEGELACGLLYAGSGSAIGGLTALWWRELLNRRPTLIHVDAPARACSRADLRIRHPNRVEREWHGALPTVPLTQALLTASHDLAHNSLRLVLARAEFKGHLSLRSLQAALAEGRPGTRAIRAAMDAHLPQLARCANAFERSFVLLCERYGLPIPDPNERVGRYRPDMLWRSARVIVELDGKDAHSTPAQLLADERRQRHLESLGYMVIRFTWAEVTHEPERVAATTRRYTGS